MLLTLELFVFAFSVVTALMTALIQLLNRLNSVLVSLAQLRQEVDHIREDQTQQSKDIGDLRHEINSQRNRRHSDP